MDVVKILDKLQTAGLVRVHRQVNNYMQVYCPFHNDGNEKKPSCGVLIHEEVRNGQRYPEGWWHCFSCQKVATMEEAVTEILKNKSISKSGSDWLKENVPGFEGTSNFDYLIPTDTMQQLSGKFALNYIRARTSEPIQDYVSEEELQRYRYTVPYMYERKLTDDIIARYDIGYDGDWIPPGRKQKVPCITFPVRDKSGRTLFLCRRSIVGKLFNYPAGVTKPVYGIDMISTNCKTLLICESCLDALLAVSWGYDAIALLGTGNSYQIQQLKELGVSEFVICTDGDDAGIRAAKKLRNALSSVAIVWTVKMPPGKDVNDLTESEFYNLYQERE